MNISDTGALNYLPSFNDMPVYSCWIDGQTFNDAGVYQQHMLMSHGLNLSVKASDGSTIKAPLDPVIPPPDPYFTPAPGVTLKPVDGGNFTPVYTPPLKTISPQPYIPAPVRPGVPYNPATGQAGTVSGSVDRSGSGWALAGLILACVAFGAHKIRTRKRGR